jgi:hypothetical protein
LWPLQQKGLPWGGLIDYSNDDDSASLLNRNDGLQGDFIISYPGNGGSILVAGGLWQFPRKENKPASAFQRCASEELR